jgi:hypothetical protein
MTFSRAAFGPCFMPPEQIGPATAVLHHSLIALAAQVLKGLGFRMKQWLFCAAPGNSSVGRILNDANSIKTLRAGRRRGDNNGSNRGLRREIREAHPIARRK